MAHLTVREALTATDALLEIEGEIDAATVDQFTAVAHHSLRSAPERVVIDLGGVTYCDSRGVAALAGLRREANSLGTRVALTNVGESLARVFNATGIVGSFDRASPP